MNLNWNFLGEGGGGGAKQHQKENFHGGGGGYWIFSGIAQYIVNLDAFEPNRGVWFAHWYGASNILFVTLHGRVQCQVVYIP